MVRTSQQKAAIERRIAKQVVEDALAAGYTLNVDNGGDELELASNSSSAGEVLDAMFATTSEYLIFFKGNQRAGWVWFVYQNDGWDCVSNYTTNLESVLKNANEIADSYD